VGNNRTGFIENNVLVVKIIWLEVRQTIDAAGNLEEGICQAMSFILMQVIKSPSSRGLNQ